MLWILLSLIVLMLPFAAIGYMNFVFWVKPGKLPADKSNVINRIRLWWFCTTRPHLFVDTFIWLRNDELDNVEQITEIRKRKK